MKKRQYTQEFKKEAVEYSLTSRKTVDRYRFIRGYTKLFSVKKMCQVLKVSRSGYYDWVKYPLSKRRIEDMKLKQKIVVPVSTKNCYGKAMLLVKSGWKG